MQIWRCTLDWALGPIYTDVWHDPGSTEDGWKAVFKDYKCNILKTVSYPDPSKFQVSRN